MVTMSTTVEYRVTGMSCAHCERSITEEVGGLSTVTDVEVHHETGQLLVTADQTPDDATVIAAVAEAGYTASRV